jgi:hypothetical protein
MSKIERTEKATAWELRTAWAKRRPVALTLSERCVVAVAGAFVIIDGWHVPCADVLGVASAHYSQKAAT